MIKNSNGGYDEGYAACPCFWGPELGSLVKLVLAKLPDMINFRVLDAGCGEGKNAIAFASRGARVSALDCSELALRNAQRAWPDKAVEWIHGDVRSYNLPLEAFDVVIAYGLLHCLRQPLRSQSGDIPLTEGDPRGRHSCDMRVQRAAA